MGIIASSGIVACDTNVLHTSMHFLKSMSGLERRLPSACGQNRRNHERDFDPVWSPDYNRIVVMGGVKSARNTGNDLLVSFGNRYECP